jgi:hypothetical protein
VRAEKVLSQLAIKLHAASMATKVALEMAAYELHRAEREAAVYRDLVQLETADRLRMPLESEAVFADVAFLAAIDKVSRLRELRERVEREMDK